MRFGMLVMALLVVVSTDAKAQTYLNQVALQDLLTRRAISIYDIPEVTYRYYTTEEESRLRARLRLWEEVGRENGDLIRLLNRTELHDFRKGDTLIVPDRLDLEMRAYTPYPHIYAGGIKFDKLVVIDKTTQTFAAYRWGELERWGIINTGSLDTPTPNGRFNANYRDPYRRSSLNWNWEMYWVVNFHEARGIHMHHYAVPLGGPGSRGCVRMVDEDAEWLFHWVDLRRVRNGRIVDQGTTIIVVGDEPEGYPILFIEREGRPEMVRVELPDSPWDVEPGTQQQRNFDQIRERQIAQQ